jgi:hypothetical protein
MKLRYILPVLMTLVYIALVVSAPAQYYIGYEKLRGTYIVVGTPTLQHRAAYGMNAPATAIAMLWLRVRGRLTGNEELVIVGTLVPVLWFLVGAFIDRTMRDQPRAVGWGAAGVLIIALAVLAFLESRFVIFVWIAFAAWVLWERARWRRAAQVNRA